MCSAPLPRISSAAVARRQRAEAARRNNFHSQHLFEHIYCAANLIIKNTQTECLFTLCDTFRGAAGRRSGKLDGKWADGDGEDKSDECFHLPAQIRAVGRRCERR